MITVACFQWWDPHGKCNALYVYGPKHVRALKAMVANHLARPHRFVVVTNQPERYGADLETVPLDMTTFVSATRYAKLMLFRRDAVEIFGPRILYLDLDTVIVGALDPLVDRDEPLVLFRNPNFKAPKRARFNTSMMLLTAGCRPDLYEDFDPAVTPAAMREFTTGTDQAWISQQTDPDNPYWDHTHGVYSAPRPRDSGTVGATLPEGARVVFFPGPHEPHQARVQDKHPWIRTHLPA